MATNFGVVDWLIVAGYLGATVVIALKLRRSDSGLADFLVAGRGLRTSLGVATMVGSELGLVTVVYSAQKGFTGGLAALHIPLVAGIVALLVGWSGFIVGPLRRAGVMTIPEFYELRFGRRIRIFGGLLLAFAGILNMGLFLRAGSIFVTALTGLDSAIAVKWVMTGLITLVLVYVVSGGMVAVVITDYIQFVVLSFGLLVSCVLAVRAVGWSEVVAAVEQVHGQAGFDPFATGGFGTEYVVWMIFTAGLVSCALWPTAVARACSAESEGVVRRLYMLSSIGFVIRFLIPNLLGVCALAYAVSEPAMAARFLPDGVPASAEETLAALPVFLGQILPAGLIGLVAAGMLAAFMSTHDSYLLCWSSVLVQDVVAPLKSREMTAEERLRLIRILIVVIGGFLLIWSLWYPLQQDLWDYMAVTGAVYFSGAFVVLVGGLYTKRASAVGAGLALAAGSCAALGLAPLQELVGLDSLLESFGWSLDGETAGLLSVAFATLGMLIGSVLRPSPENPVAVQMRGRETS